ncbi:C45 family autoproteolytic acyltransferase/hydolase [Leptolyngbya ohadii]|uniref:C45 family autoproteolytic acyltransferase/hydolase n=1 Tax=Leptolyngbya ohadii TaxID=1962290 RepID=UPI0019D44258|nr:C45 family autoproteolytic acyltransferase/hydolase [Leptolyngbya ohadii]
MLRKFSVWRNLLLAVGMICLILIGRANASETILLQYRDLKLNIPLTELQQFAETGTPSEALQQFFEQSQQNPIDVRNALTTAISARSTPLIPKEFALLEISKAIGDPLRRERLEPLSKAFGEVLKNENQTFSLIDLLAAYPESTARLSLDELLPVYQDVNLFVTRISPILSVAEKLLPEMLCNCQAVVSDSDSPAAIAYQEGSQTVKSLLTEAPSASISKSTSTSTSSTSSTSTSPTSTSASAGKSIGESAEESTGKSIEESTEQVNRNAIAIASRSNQQSSPLPDKRLVIEFGPLRQYITIAELTEFVETGKLPGGWQFYLNIAGIKPEDLQIALTQEIKMNVRFLDRTLNSLLGEYLLFQVGQIVHTPSKLANIQALRSALVLSAADDNRITFLELLYHYPTQEMRINGARLARLGQTASRLRTVNLQQQVVSLEDWLVEVQASVAEQTCDCSQPIANSTVLAPLTIAPETRAKYLPPDWKPVAAHREDIGNLKVVWLEGTPYDMGYQHGQFLHDEIASIGQPVLETLRFVGRGLALGHLAKQRSYAYALEECRGLAAATQDLGITPDSCMVLAYGDVYQSVFGYTLPQELFWDGCSQFVAANAATVDGYLYHGSTVDNGTPIDYIINNPVVFVRQPQDGLPHVFVTYPGVLWPNSGLNVAGISLGLDTAETRNTEELSFSGGSNVQMMAQVLQGATSFEEAVTFMQSQPKVHPNIIMLTDGNSKQAGVLEFTGQSFAVRPLQDNGVLFATNHFVVSEMFDKQAPPDNSTLSRYARYEQLLQPEGQDSYYGRIDPTIMTQILRDRVNPYTLEASPTTTFDDNSSPGGNGSLRQAIYDPKRLKLWVAAGKPPVPQNPFVCLSLGKLLNFPNAEACTAPAIP